MLTQVREDTVHKRKLRLGAAITLLYITIYYAYFLPLIFGGLEFIRIFGAATTIFMAVGVILAGMVGVLAYHAMASRMEQAQ